MKCCYNTNSTLPKECQRSRSILQDGSRTFGLFWKEKTLSYNRKNTVPVLIQKVKGIKSLPEIPSYLASNGCPESCGNIE